MIWHLIAAVICGLAAAGIALFLRKISGQLLPKWIIPVFAGAGMLGYQIYTEYSWFDLKQQQLPEESIVITKEKQAKVWRPWTYAFPLTSAFTILDTSNLQYRQMNQERVAQFVLYRFERQHIDRVTNQTYGLNCANRQLLPLNDQRQPELENLRQLRQDDPLFQQVCKNGQDL